MTGKDLIMYILKNNLEDEPVFKDGKFVGFSTVPEMAAKLGVGSATVETWASLGSIESVNVTGGIYIPNEW